MFNSRGFSLIEVLIAGSLTALSLAVMATSFTNIRKGIIKIEQNHNTILEAQNIANRIQMGATTQLETDYTDWKIEKLISNEHTPLLETYSITHPANAVFLTVNRYKVNIDG